MAILNFQIFVENGKTPNWLCLLNHFVEFFYPRISKQYNLPTFHQVFKKWWSFQIFKFSPKVAEHKLLPYPLQTEWFHWNFWCTGCLSNKICQIFKNLLLSKIVAILNFPNCSPICWSKLLCHQRSWETYRDRSCDCHHLRRRQRRQNLRLK